MGRNKVENLKPIKMAEIHLPVVFQSNPYPMENYRYSQPETASKGLKRYDFQAVAPNLEARQKYKC